MGQFFSPLHSPACLVLKCPLYQATIIVVEIMTASSSLEMMSKTLIIVYQHLLLQSMALSTKDQQSQRKILRWILFTGDLECLPGFSTVKTVVWPDKWSRPFCTGLIFSFDHMSFQIPDE